MTTTSIINILFMFGKNQAKDLSNQATRKSNKINSKGRINRKAKNATKQQQNIAKEMETGTAPHSQAVKGAAAQDVAGPPCHAIPRPRIQSRADQFGHGSYAEPDSSYHLCDSHTPCHGHLEQPRSGSSLCRSDAAWNRGSRP